MTESIAALVAAHAGGKRIPATIEETYARIAAHADPALFITLRRKADALAEAKRLEAEGPVGKPLYGVPFAVKDNIDVAGLPTTAACPAFAYTPERSAFVVEALERAGRHRDRQDQPRPVRNRTRRRPLALWRPAQRPSRRSYSRRIELRVGDGGWRGAGPVLARHGHRGLGPRSRGAQRDRRPETLARRAVGDRPRARLPHARHDLDLRARRRRRLRRVRGGLRLRRSGRLFPPLSPSRAFGTAEGLENRRAARPISCRSSATETPRRLSSATSGASRRWARR